MLKAALRKLYKQKRINLTYREKEKMSDLILIGFQRMGSEIPGIVMSYVPIEKFNEYDPMLIVDYCRFLNPQLVVCFPVISEPGSPMKAVAVENIDDAEFQINHLGFAEPVNGIEINTEEIDLVIVPLLAFDKTGNRVGYGKGYYDIFLKDCRKDTLKTGVSFFEPVLKIEDVNQFDISLDYCITPQTVYQFQ